MKVQAKMAYVRVVTDTEPVPSMPSEPALKTKYDPDRFQKFAIQAIEAGENVLVTAKTGSGKTFVGEYQIAKSLQRGGRVFYTTPIKSLSNQKFHDLKELFPEASVGIMTGDIKFRPDAQIIVMTTEILRNLLFKKGTTTESVGLTSLISLEGLDAVVFDEVHYINDPDRGHVWEETIMLLPPSIKLILLSATLSTPLGFATWLGESKKVRVWLISTLWRAVPLEHCIMENNRPLVIYDAKEDLHESVYSAWLRGKGSELLAHDKFKEKVRDARLGGHEGPLSGKTRPKAFEHQMNECLDYLQTHGNLPAIFFVFSRAGCERLASKVNGSFLDSSDAATVAHIWDFHLSRYKDSLEKSPQYNTLRTLAMRGIAFHHSGILPFLKEILEILFNKSMIKVLFATETFAVGINMPTKTVVFTALEKYSDGMRALKSSEYIQMAGRAGRRGKDDKGLVIYLPQKEAVPLSMLRGILTGRAASFGSRMNFHYDFVLKLLHQQNLGASETMIENSYWWALQNHELSLLKKEVDAVEHQPSLLSQDELAACEKGDSLEMKVASLQNSKKKAALRELDGWRAELPWKESVWGSIQERYKKYKESLSQLASVKNTILSLTNDMSVPIVRLRHQILVEYGYVDSVSGVTQIGRLASEVNEGHPFLLTELFLRLRGNSTSWQLTDLLILLSVFLGDSRDSCVLPAGLPDAVTKEVKKIEEDAMIGMKREERLGISDPSFWTITKDWLEPIQAWVNGTDILPVVACSYDIYEGNLQKSLMKLMGIVEEFRGLCTLENEVGWLSVLEGAQALVLRDVVVAESLYLRL
jgi:superfamily II RNA helicase